LQKPQDTVVNSQDAKSTYQRLIRYPVLSLVGMPHKVRAIRSIGQQNGAH